ncbi:FAD/NAD(P)-binding protein [Kitasatospora sp. NPDC051853]|uniref:FAD/NAD(P)-binding protein n=1 Tax=Kitasatospora sp. NPDC051853 TaxID=3364058 RepID=UPI00379BBE76
MTTDRNPQAPLSLGIIGSGPRGLSVLERLAARLNDGELSGRQVRIHLIDAVEVGSGRVWRTDQDDWFTMNTVVGQVTMYSGDPDGGPARPGAGPSLGQWIAERARTHGEPLLGPDDYASRQRYGQYQQAVYRSIADNLPERVELVPVKARVTQARPAAEGGYVLELDAAPYLVEVDQLLLATGHPTNKADAFERGMFAFADRHPGLAYLAGDSAADMALDQRTVRPGSTVAIRGLGLSFYDVMLSLTVGRGGTFATDADGTLRYLASGLEPKIVTGSRSGLPIPARGRNQKNPNHSHKPRFLTSAAVADARKRRIEAGGSGLLRFDEDVLPLLMQEVEAVRADSQARAGGAPLAPLDLDALARPFRGKEYAGPEQFRAELLDIMREDLDAAQLGNADGPLKSALDVLRDIRNVVREAVDYGGLQPDSYVEEFQKKFLPVNSLLSAGPPIERVEQLVALIEAGVVEVAGPATEFEADEAAGKFRISSPQVAGSVHHAEVLVDARIPTPDLHKDTSPLTTSLLADGLIGEYVMTDPTTGAAHATGGLNVTEAPFRVIDADGRIRCDLYALGIPTEHTRWFTQVGSGKPGLNTLFRRDADSIAAAMLDRALTTTAPQTATITAGGAA